MSYLGFCPPGVIMPFAGAVAPDGWLLCNGSAISRTTYSALFDVLSPSQTCNTTNASTTVTVQNSTSLSVGMSVFGSGIASGATISSITNSTTIVISAAASATQTGVTLRFSGYGVGDGSTTFNLPDYRGRFLRGTDTMGTAAGRDPDRTTRSAAIAGANAGDNVGSVQSNATAKNSLAVSSVDIRHSHAFAINNPIGSFSNNATGLDIMGGANVPSAYGTSKYSGGPSLSDLASHTHTITGDNETRPVNINVNYIIKI